MWQASALARSVTDHARQLSSIACGAAVELLAAACSFSLSSGRSVVWNSYAGVRLEVEDRRRPKRDEFDAIAAILLPGLRRVEGYGTGLPPL